MPYIILHEKANYEFQYSTTIQTRDLNYVGHLGNDKLVVIIQDARNNLFHELGFQERDMGDGRTGIIIGDMVVNFKGEGFLFDELLVESHIGESTPKSFRLFHRIVNVKDKKLIALVETGLIAYDYEMRKVTAFPEVFNRALSDI